MGASLAIQSSAAFEKYNASTGSIVGIAAKMMYGGFVVFCLWKIVAPVTSEGGIILKSNKT